MKSTGIVRKVDELGRVVIPKEIRKTQGIEEGDGLEIYMDGENLVLTKYQPGCQICNQMTGVTEVKGVRLCKECAKNFI